jgi:uncharacterized membrane protein YcaP (DUF421 family)
MDLMNILKIVIRSAGSLMALFFLTKMLGRKQVSQLSAFDYVIGISMGSIAAEMAINVKIPFLDGLTAMIVYAIVAFVISFLTIKSIRCRHFFTGTPVILIQDGKIIKRNLRKSLLDINDLMQECRSSGYFNIGDIAYAVMEACGKLSFLPKTPNRPVVLKDLKLKDTVAGLYANVILDGNIMDNSLKIIKKNSKWLLKEIKKQGFDGPESIFLATVDVNYDVSIYEKIENIESKDVL